MGERAAVKVPFSIHGLRPTLEVTLTRDSVCMGDDCDAPHQATVEVPSSVDPGPFVRAVASGYLPSVAGMGHSWICQLNGKPIAEIYVGRTVLLVDELVFEEKNAVFFAYRSATW